MDSNPGLSTPQLDDVNEIFNAGNHLLTLINEVLELAKIESGQVTISVEHVEVADAFRASVQLVKPLAQKRGIEIIYAYRDETMSLDQFELYHHHIQADFMRLKQVLINLLSNAIKYNRLNGEVNILVKPLSKGRIKVGVSDMGKGISKSDIPKLFEAFNRLGAEKSEIEGTGIGLPITKKIIELMDGILEVESIEGEGSVFWVELNGKQQIAA